MRSTGPWPVIASRCPRVCLRRAHGSVKLDPHGVPSLVGTCPRVRPWLTRGYRRFDPYGVAGLAVWFGGVVAVPPRCGVSSPAGGWQGACRAAADPIGVALLITAGKRSAPADRNPTLFRPHGGRTSSRRRADTGMRSTGPWPVIASRCPRVCLRRAHGSVKLDPHGVPSLVGTCPRVRPWLTRGYRRFDPYGVAGLAVWFGGVVAVPPHGISSPAGGWQGACRAALCAIWQTVKADTHGCLRFSVGKAARWGARGHPSHRFPFSSHGSADPSHGIFDPRPLSSGFLGSICAI